MLIQRAASTEDFASVHEGFGGRWALSGEIVSVGKELLGRGETVLEAL